MRSPPLSRRDRRALGFGAFVVGVLILLTGTRWSHDRWADLRTRVGAERDLLARELRLLEQAGWNAERMRAATDTLDRWMERIFTGPDVVSATAELLRYLEEVRAPHRMVIEHGDTRQATELGTGLYGLQAEIRGAGDLEGILGFLAALEEGPRLARVERVTLERTRPGIPAASVDSAEDTEVLIFWAIIRSFGLIDPVSPSGTESGDVTGRSTEP